MGSREPWATTGSSWSSDGHRYLIRCRLPTHPVRPLARGHDRSARLDCPGPIVTNLCCFRGSGYHAPTHVTEHRRRPAILPCDLPTRRLGCCLPSAQLQPRLPVLQAMDNLAQSATGAGPNDQPRWRIGQTGRWRLVAGRRAIVAGVLVPLILAELLFRIAGAIAPGEIRRPT